MKISLKWLSNYIDIKKFLTDPEGPQKLSALLTQGGLEVEGVENQSQQFKHVVVAKILEMGKHPGADKLTLCKVSTGDKEHKIVCGAKNHKAGDIVVLAMPGAVLPGDFAIKVSKIRGEESHGMLCSEKELGLPGDSGGIMILPPNAKVGENFAKYAKLDDVIIDISVTPNRSDCLSHFGLAREISGLTGTAYEFPIVPFTEGRESTRKLIKVNVDDQDRCPRYAGRVVQNVKVGPSPQWLRVFLEAVGLRSINNVVDITNFVMMELGQPLHAFDMDLLSGPQINVRAAKEGEHLKTLDEQDLKLDGSELVIADGKGPVALAGVMGGEHSGVNNHTRDVFVESAYFIPSTVRRAARRHGMSTDSSYRFSRGIDPDGVNLALNRACQLLGELAGGTVCSDSYDNYPRPIVKSRIPINLEFISQRLGFEVTANEAKKLLERVGCSVTGSGQKLMVNPPQFRADLNIQEDLAEEILRLKGFEQVPEKLPDFGDEPTRDNSRFGLDYRMAETFASMGLNQSVNLSFTSSKFQKSFLGSEPGQPKELGLDYTPEWVEIQNPLNIELDVLRVSLLPSLARNAAHNASHGEARGGLFEISPVFFQKEKEDLKGPRPFTEESRAAMILWGEEEGSWFSQVGGAPLFYRLKGVLEGFLEAWRYKMVRFDKLENVPSFLHPGQSARVFVEGKAVGVIGVLHPLVLEDLDLRVPAVVAELNLELLYTGQPKTTKVKPISKYPSIDRDVAFLTPSELPAGDVKTQLLKAAGKSVVHCEIFDVFSGKGVPAGQKSLAFRLTYQDSTKTLSDDEINAVHQKAVQTVCQKLSLSVR